MKYIDQLRQAVSDLYNEGGLLDWDLIEEIKRLHRFEKLGQKIERLASHA